MKKITVLTILILLIPFSVSIPEYYAVLITGDTPALDAGVTPTWNGGDLRPIVNEFWCDTFLMWECLWNYGLKDENIYVLFSNGADWTEIDTSIADRYDATELYGLSHGITSITDDSAYVDDVEDIFEYLDGVMTSDDFLFVYTFGHGSKDSTGTYLKVMLDSTTGEYRIYDYELAAMLPENYDTRVFWMQQCKGGGFINDLANENTVVLTAVDSTWFGHQADNDEPDCNDPWENEYIGIDDYYHGEFNYHMFNALRLKTVYYENGLDSADTDNNGLADLVEMYNWEIDHNSIWECPLCSLDHDTIWEVALLSDSGNIADEIFLNIPPYPPENLDYTLDENNHPILEWDLNTEYDIDQYKVYRQFKDPYQSYPIVNIATLDHPTHTYTDYEVVSNPELQSGAFYQVTALDEAGSESDKSNRVSLRTYVPNSEDEVTAVASSYLENFGISLSPNPFNASTTLSFNLPASGPVELKVYDVRGREVQSLVAGQMSLGQHQVVWDAEGMGSGVYFVRLMVDGGQLTEVQKVLLVK